MHLFCRCFLPHLQESGILDKFVTGSPVYPHIGLAFTCVFGCGMTYSLHRTSRRRRLTPTKCLFIVGYMFFCTVGLLLFPMWLAIQFVDGFVIPWGSRFRLPIWVVAPFAMMTISIVQIRHLLRTGNPQEFREAYERRRWYTDNGFAMIDDKHPHKKDPPTASILWPALTEFFDKGFSSPSGLIAHGTCDLLGQQHERGHQLGARIKDALQPTVRSSISNGGQEAHLAHLLNGVIVGDVDLELKKGTCLDRFMMPCICFTCTPLYFLLIDMAFAPFMILSGFCCGTRLPCSEQVVSNDFLKHHPSKVSDDWANRHPEAVPTHRMAVQIWDRFTKEGEEGYGYDLKKFTVRRSKVLLELLDYEKQLREKRSSVMMVDVTSKIKEGKVLVREGKRWSANITASFPEKEQMERGVYESPLYERQDTFGEEQEETKEIDVEEGFGERRLSTKLSTLTADELDWDGRFVESFLYKQRNLVSALEACEAAKYTGIFSTELIAILETSVEQQVSGRQVPQLIQVHIFTDSFLSLASLGTATTRCVMGGVLRDQGLGLGLDHRHTTCLSFFASLTRTAADRWRGAR
jgi:hypothetical protein